MNKQQKIVELKSILEKNHNLACVVDGQNLEDKQYFRPGVKAYVILA